MTQTGEIQVAPGSAFLSRPVLSKMRSEWFLCRPWRHLRLSYVPWAKKG